MLKRIISILLTVLMCMSMVTFTAMADDTTVSVTYLNADSTKIMIDLSAEVSVADLTKAISLKKDGAPVNFTVVKKPASVVASTGAMTASTDVSYVIKPEGGVTIGAIYNLNIAGTDCNKFFSVEELWKDDFQIYEGDTGATTSWRNGTLYVDGTEKYLKITGMAGKATYPYSDSYNFSTYGMTATKFFDTARRATTDYNVEARVKFDAKDDGSAYRTVQISMQADRGQSVGRWGVVPCIAGGALYNIKADGTDEYNKLFLDAYQNANTTDRQSIGQIQDNLHQTDGPKISQHTFNVGWNTISMSVKGNNAKVFAGEDAFGNYNHTLDLSTGYGAVGIFSRSSGTYYIDDVIATKMREVELGDMTVNYWNADSSKIMLDLSANVDASALKKEITLTKNGTEVTDFTVTKKVKTPEATGGLTTVDDYTYVIEPQGGIVLSTSEKETVYSLTVNEGLMSSDKTKLLPNAYNINFAVDKLWIEDFENENYTSTAFPWYDSYSSNTSTLTLVTEEDNTVMSVKPSSQSSSIQPTIYNHANNTIEFADTGKTSAVYWANGSDARLMEEYNVEMKVKFLGTTSRYMNINLGAGNSGTSYKYGASGIGVGAYHKLDGTDDRLLVQASVKGTGYTYTAEGAGTIGESALAMGYVNSTYGIPYSSDSYNTISVSVKAKNIKFFPGDDAFANYNYTTVDPKEYGLVVIAPRSTAQFYVDDIVVTKAREVVVGPKFGTSLNVVDAEEGKVNVSWEYDGKGNNLPCKVILACYGENNSLKNVIPWDGTNLSGNGTITFENFELKGGTELKLFVWKDLTTLYPYCATVQWPQAD